MNQIQICSCWVDFKTTAVWALVGPVAVIFLANFLVLILSLRVLWRRRSGGSALLSAQANKDVNIRNYAKKWNNCNEKTEIQKPQKSFKVFAKIDSSSSNPNAVNENEHINMKNFSALRKNEFKIYGEVPIAETRENCKTSSSSTNCSAMTQAPLRRSQILSWIKVTFFDKIFECH